MELVVLVPKLIEPVFTDDLVFLQFILKSPGSTTIGHTVQDLFKVLQRDVQHVPDSTGNGLQNQMCATGDDRTMCPIRSRRTLDWITDTTLFTNNAAVFRSLVSTTITLVVFYWAKDFGTKQAIPFRLKRPVVDGFRFLYLTVRPLRIFFGDARATLNASTDNGSLGFSNVVNISFTVHLLLHIARCATLT